MTSCIEFEILKQVILKNKFLPVPPEHRNFVSPESKDFLSQGVSLMGNLIDEGLKPEHSILDLGSGIGRLAIPLTQYLVDEGSYLGLDINLSGVAWCHENLTQKYPNFEFAVVNARNKHYAHPYEYGNEDVRTASVPIRPGKQFDVACAFSLFTHLLWDDVEEYFCVVSSHLKAGGFFYSTWFLLNEASRNGIQEGTSRFDFDIDVSGPTCTLKNVKYSRAISHDESAVLSLAEKYGMHVRGKIRHSGWHEGKPGQDVLVLIKN